MPLTLDRLTSLKAASRDARGRQPFHRMIYHVLLALGKNSPAPSQRMHASRCACSKTQCTIRLPCGHCDYDRSRRGLETFCEVAGARIEVGVNEARS